MLVVHPHFHRRRTGVTAHTENIVPALARTLEARGLGKNLAPQVPRTSLGEVWARAGTETVIWHAHRNNELLVGLCLKALGWNLKVVFTRHGGERPGGWTRFLAGFADERITLNAENAAQLGHRSHVVSHGVDLVAFQPPFDRAQSFAALKLPGRFGVGVVGRVRPAKGQADFVAALTPLLPQHPEWTPVLVGLVKAAQASWAEELKAQTGGRLQLVGEHPDIARWYHGLSIVVQPSHSESFGIVLLEAMATGACVVATRLPHVPALIDDGVTGFLYQPGDVEGLRRILTRLLDDPGLVAKVGEAAAQESRRRFGVEHEARELARVYQHATREPSP
jgi:mannosyltransferase